MRLGRFCFVVCLFIILLIKCFLLLFVFFVLSFMLAIEKKKIVLVRREGVSVFVVVCCQSA